MVERIIEFCAKNRLLVLLGVAFATVGAVWVHRAGQTGRHSGSVRSAGHHLHEWMGRSPTLVEDQVTYPSCPRWWPLLTWSMCAATRCSHVVRVRGVRRRNRRVLGAQSRARVHEWHKAEAAEGVDSRDRARRNGIGWVFQYALVDKSGKHASTNSGRFRTSRCAMSSERAGRGRSGELGGYEKQYQVTVDPTGCAPTA